MTNSKTLTLAALVSASALLLTACGGGGGGSSDTSTPVTPVTPTTPTTPTTPSTDLQTTVPTATYSAASAELSAFNVVNTERSRCGFGMVAQSTTLDTAAAAHANYLKLRFSEGIIAGHEEDPTKSGYYATTGTDRAVKAGYAGYSAGEYISFYNIGTTTDYGNALVRSMMATVYHAAGMLDGNRDVGVAVSFADPASTGYQLAALSWQPGTATGAAQQDAKDLVTYPCQGTTGVQPYMFGESPDPFVGLGFTAGTNVGHPIYLRAPAGKAIKLDSADLVSHAGKTIAVFLYQPESDPNKMLAKNQAFVVPREALAESTSYTVQIRGTIDGAAFATAFTFSTLKF